MPARQGKTFGVLSFFLVLVPTFGSAASYTGVLSKRFSPRHVIFHKALKLADQIERDPRKPVLLSEQEAVDSPAPFAGLVPVQATAAPRRLTSSVVAASRFVLIRGVSRNLFLSILNL